MLRTEFRLQTTDDDLRKTLHIKVLPSKSSDAVCVSLMHPAKCPGLNSQACALNLTLPFAYLSPVHFGCGTRIVRR